MSYVFGLIPGDRGTTNPTRAGFIDGSEIEIPAAPHSVLPGDPDAPVVSVVTEMDDVAGGAILRAFADLFYFRVWAIPRVLDAQNPRIGSPIPFKLWNAYLDPNEVEGISYTGSDGVTLDLTDGQVLAALEIRTVGAIIGEDAPYQIDTTFTFDFALGGTTLRFLALLADILPVEADTSIVERYEWLTDVLGNYDGTEQRIALRGRPRRSFIISLTLLDDADRKALYDKLYKVAALSVITPAYQYQSQLKADTIIGDNKVYCNPIRADLRVGENVILLTRDGLFFFYKVESVLSDHVVISTAFSQVIPKRGTKVFGGFAGRLPDNTSLSMKAISGQSQIQVDIIDSRDQIAYPDYEVTLPTLSGFPMLLRRPLADGDTPDAFMAGLEVIDNATGKPAQYSAWDQRYVTGQRKYLINGLFDKDEMQYWRTFLDYCRGQQRKFLTPTYRQDLVMVEGSEFLVTKIEVVGSEYATQYFPTPTYRHLEIETSAGTFQVAVSNVENNGVSTSINFVDPIDADLTDVTVSRISYLMLMRLGTDVVTLTHEDTYSTVDLTLRAIKA